MNQFLTSSEMMNTKVVAFAVGDVNGDRVPDNVYLTGKTTTDSPFIQNITLIVQDGKSGRFTKIDLAQNVGYSPTLFLGDFTGDGIDDILVRIDSGGSGAFTYDYIYTFIQNTPKLIFDSDVYNELFLYDVTYKNNYRVEVVSQYNQTKYILDMTYKGAEYLNEIYNPDGTLKEPISGFVGPLSGLYPVEFTSNKVYELLAFQKVAGRYNADGLGYVQNILRWDKTKFVLRDQMIGIFGAPVT